MTNSINGKPLGKHKQRTTQSDKGYLRNISFLKSCLNSVNNKFELNKSNVLNCNLKIPVLIERIKVVLTQCAQSFYLAINDFHSQKTPLMKEKAKLLSLFNYAFIFSYLLTQGKEKNYFCSSPVLNNPVDCRRSE